MLFRSVQKGPKMGQKGAQKGPKWPKMAQNGQNLEIFRIFSFPGNALKWYPNGLKRSQNTFLLPVDPLLAHFGRFPPAFWGIGGLLGSKRGQNGPKMAQNGQNVEIFPIFSFGWKCTKMVSKWSQTVPKHIFYGPLAPFWPIFGPFLPYFYPMLTHLTLF